MRCELNQVFKDMNACEFNDIFKYLWQKRTSAPRATIFPRAIFMCAKKFFARAECRNLNAIRKFA
jgi:hypothetical protein